MLFHRNLHNMCSEWKRAIYNERYPVLIQFRIVLVPSTLMCVLVYFVLLAISIARLVPSAAVSSTSCGSIP